MDHARPTDADDNFEDQATVRNWVQTAPECQRTSFMMHALPRDAGSPRFKVKPEALYHDWPAAHTALLQSYVFNRADIDGVVDVLQRGYLWAPDEPDPAEGGGDGPDPVALLCRLAARRFGLIVVKPTADDPQGVVTSAFSINVPSDVGRFAQIHRLCQVLAGDFNCEVRGIEEGDPWVRFSVAGIACLGRFCDAFGELRDRLQRESLYERLEFEWHQGYDRVLLYDLFPVKSQTDFFGTVVERIDDGPPGPQEAVAKRPRPRRAKSSARGGRVTGQWALASAPPPGHDIVIGPFSHDHMERVRKALTLGFLVVEGKWHHDGLEPCDGEFAFDCRDLFLGCCRRYRQPWVIVYCSPRSGNIAAGLPGIDGDPDAALTVREACEIYTAASPFRHPEGCYRWSLFTRFLEGVGVQRLPRETCEAAGFRLHELLAEIMDRRADPDGQDGYGKCVGLRGDRAEAVDGVATVAAAMAGSVASGPARRYIPGWPAWRRRRFIYDDVLYEASLFPQTGGRHPECFDANIAPRPPGKRRSRRGRSVEPEIGGGSARDGGGP
jgi:hypothetical protein